jgi:hypothetical protein
MFEVGCFVIKDPMFLIIACTCCFSATHLNGALVQVLLCPLRLLALVSFEFSCESSTMYTQRILPILVLTKLIHYEGDSQGILGIFLQPVAN